MIVMMIAFNVWVQQTKTWVEDDYTNLEALYNTIDVYDFIWIKIFVT